MTESDWLTSTDSAAMLGFLVQPDVVTGEHTIVGVSDRKLRLFAAACCRQVWDGAPCQRCEYLEQSERWHVHGNERCSLTYARMGCASDCTCTCKREDCPNCHGTGRVGGLTDPRSRRAVEVAERYADGEINYYHDVLPVAHRAYAASHRSGDIAFLPWAAVGDDIKASLGNNWFAVSRAFSLLAHQAVLLRCIVGNQWRPVILWPGECTRKLKPTTLQEPYVAYLHSDVVRWNDGTVPKLAQAIYADRCWEDLPILADALEEAGCDDAAILAHLRGNGPHAKGCHVVDLILGKQ